MKNRQSKKYIIATLQDGVLTRQIMDQKRRNKITFDTVDVTIDEPKGFVYLKHNKGEIEEISLAKREWDLLLEIFWSEGDPYQLLSIGTINQAVRTLRRHFGDSKYAENYFRTCKTPTYRIWLNTQKTWRFIEVLAEATQPVE